jgi:hypothetical protein
MDGEGSAGGRVGRGSGNVPFEFVGEVARAGAVAEARDVERGAAAARHVRCAWVSVRRADADADADAGLAAETSRGRWSRWC